ncbi:hypothetical protein DID88_001989 [Monilinia fructigena]|uniref:Uncharacterized protein n=1 Tax=Monilinia fructigena TaxID=38457 RepID=A0A395IXB6_9HELO|nr:hypothetical protein DID88_001989 [Monilinia fructigena]
MPIQSILSIETPSITLTPLPPISHIPHPTPLTPLLLRPRRLRLTRHTPREPFSKLCPVLVLDPNENEKYVRKTELYHYTYNWPYTPESPEHNARENQNGISKPPTMTQAVIFGLW